MAGGSALAEVDKVDDSALRLVNSPIERLKSQLAKLSAERDGILTGIQQLSDEDLVLARLNAKMLGAIAWIIECACDAEIWVRHSKFKSAPGRSDEHGEGITQALVKRAKETHTTPKTIRLNARIFNVFGERLNRTVQSLPEKEFYKVALKSEDPDATLDAFVAERTSDSKFNPARAARKIEAEKKQITTAKAEVVAQYSPPQDKTLADQIREFIAVVKKFRADCLDKSFAARMFDPIIEEFQEHLEGEMGDNAAINAVTEAWQNKCWTVNQIVMRTKLTKREVERILGLLEAQDKFLKIVLIGSTEPIWWKAGEPMAPEFATRTGAIHGNL